jgi:hypothetical protein
MEQSTEMAGGAGELCNVLRYSSAYRVALGQSYAHENFVPIPPPYPGESPLSSVPSDFSEDPEGFIESSNREPTPLSHPLLPAAPAREFAVGVVTKSETVPARRQTPRAQSPPPLRSCRAPTASTSEDGRPDGECAVIPQTPPDHAQAGPSRRVRASQSGPSTRPRHRPQGKRVRATTRGRRRAKNDPSDDEDGHIPTTPPHHTRAGRTHAIATSRRVTPPSQSGPRSKVRRVAQTLDRLKLDLIRAQYGQYVNGEVELEAYTVQRPVKVGREWPCPQPQCPHYAFREAELQRHMLTHNETRRLCGNPKCGKLFARSDAVKRHLNNSSCKDHLPQGMTVDTETPLVEIINPEEVKKDKEAKIDVRLIRL